MSQPWGLSGPQFLVIYGVGTAVVTVVPFLVRLLIRSVSSAGADRQLDPYEVGYLAGGPTRAAQVVIADFVASGAVRVDSSGRVYGADQAAFERQSAFLAEGADPGQLGGMRDRILAGVTGVAPLFAELWMPAGLSVHQFQGKIAGLPGMAAIKARLRAEGLLVSSARAAMVRMMSLMLWAALFVTGGLRLAEGAHNHRPTGNLQGLVVLSAFVCLFSLAANWSRLANLTTFRGARLVRRLRSEERRREKEAARQSRRGAAAFSPRLAGYPGLAGNGFGLGAGIGSAALFGVALVGFAAVEDESMRSALLAGLPSSSGGSSGGDGGGGGCGGGGCGGGCGG
jgi:uncharacterized protein (TIGR04222 family)